MDKIRPALGDAFDALGFMNISGWAGASTGMSVADNPGGQSIGDRGFGAQARESRRKERARVVIRDANMQIRQFLGEGKKLTDCCLREEKYPGCATQNTQQFEADFHCGTSNRKLFSLSTLHRAEWVIYDAQ